MRSIGLDMGDSV